AAMTDTRVTHRVLRATVLLAAVLALAAMPSASVAAPGSLCNTPSATGADCTGATSLDVFNNTHYALMAGATITSKIIGATDLTGGESCTGGSPGTVNVIIKSSFGDETVCGSLSGCAPGTADTACTITFSYTAPNGPDVC